MFFFLIITIPIVWIKKSSHREISLPIASQRVSKRARIWTQTGFGFHFVNYMLAVFPLEQATEIGRFKLSGFEEKKYSYSHFLPKKIQRMHTKPSERLTEILTAVCHLG